MTRDSGVTLGDHDSGVTQGDFQEFLVWYTFYAYAIICVPTFFFHCIHCLKIIHVDKIFAQALNLQSTWDSIFYIFILHI